MPLSRPALPVYGERLRWSWSYSFILLVVFMALQEREEGLITGITAGTSCRSPGLRYWEVEIQVAGEVPIGHEPLGVVAARRGLGHLRVAVHWIPERGLGDASQHHCELGREEVAQRLRRIARDIRRADERKQPIHTVRRLHGPRVDQEDVPLDDVVYGEDVDVVAVDVGRVANQACVQDAD